MQSQPSVQEQADSIKTEEIEAIVNSQPSEYTVDVSIEPNHECEIIEVKYDGQEIYKE